MNNECLGEAFIWDGRTCHCAENFDGPKCSHCNAELVCIPSNASRQVFALARIPNKYLLEQVLADPLPGYASKAFRPRIDNKYGACTCLQGPLLINGALIESYANDDDDDDLLIVNDGIAIAYIEGVYRRRYEQVANDEVAAYVAALIIIISVIVVLAIVAGCACIFFISEQRPIEKKKKSPRHSYK